MFTVRSLYYVKNSHKAIQFAPDVAESWLPIDFRLACYWMINDKQKKFVRTLKTCNIISPVSQHNLLEIFSVYHSNKFLKNIRGNSIKRQEIHCW